jgi:hypothetical protein
MKSRGMLRPCPFAIAFAIVWYQIASPPRPVVA